MSASRNNMAFWLSCRAYKLALFAYPRMFRERYGTEMSQAFADKLRHVAGGLANRLRLLRRFAPAGLVDAGIRKDLRLDAPTASLPRTPVLEK